MFHQTKMNIQDQLKKEINQLFESLEALLLSKLQATKEKNKKFLILVGDKHYDKTSLVTETILIYLAKKHQFNCLATETPKEICKIIMETKQLNDLSDKLSIYRDDERLHNSEILIRHVIDNALMTVRPVDLDLATWKTLRSYQVTSARENHMLSELAEANENTIFMVGVLHLVKLMNDSKLNSIYDILCINANKNGLEEFIEATADQLERLSFGFNPQQVMQIGINTDIDNFNVTQLVDIVQLALNSKNYNNADESKQLVKNEYKLN